MVVRLTRMSLNLTKFARYWPAQAMPLLLQTIGAAICRGLAYTKAIYADWGNKEVKDLLGAVDELVKKGIASTQDRLGISGWSYGGILTDYTIATDTRFKAAASGAGSALQLTVYGSDEWVMQYDNELGPRGKARING